MVKIHTRKASRSTYKRREYSSEKAATKNGQRTTSRQGLCRYHDRYTKLRFASFRLVSTSVSFSRRISPRLEKPTVTNNRSSRENARRTRSATIFIGGRSTGKQSRVSYRVETMVQSSQPSVVSITLYQITWTMRFRCAFCAPPSTPLVFRSFGQVTKVYRYTPIRACAKNSLCCHWIVRKQTKFSFSSLHWLKNMEYVERIWKSIKYKTRAKFFDYNEIEASFSRDDATTRIGGRRD